MTSMEQRWLVALFGVLWPRGASERIPEGAADFPTDRFVADLVRHAPPLFLLGLRAATWLVLWSPLWRAWRPARLTSLPQERADAILEGMARSRFYPVRELVMLLKTTCAMAVAGLPDVQRRAGIASHLDDTPPDWVPATASPNTQGAS